MKVTADKRYCHPVQVYLCDELYDNLNSLGGCKSDHIRAALQKYIREKRDPIERLDEEAAILQQKLGEVYSLKNRIKEEQERQIKVNFEMDKALKYKLEQLKPTIRNRIKITGLESLISDEKVIKNYSEYLGISNERFLELISDTNF
ncbi:MAG: hypothetical protein KO464_07150 [Candidatus Methanofastidiosum sp.]|nr:hypothetical protein [Methanofastidiosum sp.]